MSHILVAEDQDSVRTAVVRDLSRDGHHVDDVTDGRLAIERIQQTHYDLVLSDMRLPGSSGMEILERTRLLQPTASVILMTGFGSVDNALEAMRKGAFDYLQKPFQLEELRFRIERALEHRGLCHERDYLRHTQPHVYRFNGIVGSSGALQHVFDLVRKVAHSNATVLIRGETGTGKELIAAALHHNSHRAGRAFVKVNCAALQEDLLESELFGHERGAFTGAERQRIGRFEQADRGTLFLDEIGDMRPKTQAKVLRAVQQGEFERLGSTRTSKVDVRLIAATHRDLPAMVRQGTFREDLYYRLNVVTIDMPPLRERKSDLPELAVYFIRRFANELDREIDGLDASGRKLIMRYHWPGNIRELQNVIERAVLLSERRTLSATDLEIGDRAAPGPAGGAVVTLPPGGIPLEEIERQAITEALAMCNGVQSEAAELLSISPRVISYKIRTLGIKTSTSDVT